MSLRRSSGGAARPPQSGGSRADAPRRDAVGARRARGGGQLAPRFAYAGLAVFPSAGVPSPRDTVLQVSLVEAPPPAPEAEPSRPPDPTSAEPERLEPPPSPPPERPRRRSAPLPPPAEPPPHPSAAESPTPAETPVAFDNVVLTAEGGGSGWSVAPGSGVEREGPIGTPGALVTGRSRTGRESGQPASAATTGAPDWVAPENLSRPPSQPPGLDALLERFFPPEARAQGIEGWARVRVRIEPDGRLVVLTRLGHSGEPFAAACEQALRASPRWSPPLDRGGRPVATIIAFPCTFEVEY
ncbi:MAG: energy transducer TonB [Myxococcales bacterium]|nr:energy transducer TonB [Myxococcales bacterium]